MQSGALRQRGRLDDSESGGTSLPVTALGRGYPEGTAPNSVAGTVVPSPVNIACEVEAKHSRGPARALPRSPAPTNPRALGALDVLHETCDVMLVDADQRVAAAVGWAF